MTAAAVSSFIDKLALILVHERKQLVVRTAGKPQPTYSCSLDRCLRGVSHPW